MTDGHRHARIEVLTPHPVTLDVQAGYGAGGGGPSQGQVTIAPSGPMARVADPEVETVPLITDYGTMREVRLRRSRRVHGLPLPRPGVVYLVPRLTALAARDRTDLVFPTEEWRHEDGAVGGAAALGRFVPRTGPRSWWAPVQRAVRRIPGWRPPRPPDWLIAVAFAIATALLGATLGVLSDAIVEGFGASGERRLLLAVLAAAGGSVMVAGTLMWWWRNQVLSRRGTAYFVDEIADLWTYEEKRRFRAQVRDHFAHVLEVPGPNDLGSRWTWPLGPGAEVWSQRVDDLVRAFWTTQFNDDQETANALFVWASWPVAVSFAQRAVSGRRGVVLQVRQRPSVGRAGVRDTVDWDQEPHTFGPVELGRQVRDLIPVGNSATCTVDRRTDSGTVPTGLTVTAHAWPVTLTATAAGFSDASLNTPKRAGSLTIAVVRMIDTTWGPIRPGAAPVTDTLLPLTVHDAGGLAPITTSTATLYELRCLPASGAFHRWEHFDILAALATEWTAQVAARLDGGRLLLGVHVPAEVSVGIGIQAARRSDWPQSVLPLVWNHTVNGFVIPGLDLGSSPPRSGEGT